jgi:hypothetical protein
MQGPIGLRVAAVLYFMLGIYLLAFPILYDTSIFALYIVGGLSILCGAGIMLLKKWTLWISVVLFPVMLALSVVSLYYSVSVSGFYPDWERTLFHISLIVYLLLTVLAFLLVVDKRRDFKQSST